MYLSSRLVLHWFLTSMYLVLHFWVFVFDVLGMKLKESHVLSEYSTLITLQLTLLHLHSEEYSVYTYSPGITKNDTDRW